MDAVPTLLLVGSLEEAVTVDGLVGLTASGLAIPELSTQEFDLKL